MVSARDSVSESSTLVVPSIVTTTVRDTVSDSNLSADLEMVSASDRVSDSETLVV